MTDLDGAIPDPKVERLGGRRWPSVIWLVPILAVLGAVWLLVDHLGNRGPVITISFEEANGLKAGESVVKYRDVDVGRVERIRFSDDLETVLADVRMSKAVAPFLDESAKFWIVSPQVSAQGITGIETVIAGTYIQGSWDTEPGDPQPFFVASERPPPESEGQEGVRIVLVAVEAGSLDIGSPILFKGFDVGQVESKTLSEDGRTIEVNAFIRAPNDRYVTETTRFWNISGVDLELGTDGARLRIASLSSLLRGGATFASFGAEEGPPVQDGHVFELFGSESDAAENAVVGDPAGRVSLQVNFDGSVRGLKAGAPVEYRGIQIGRVLSVNAAVDPDTGQFNTQTLIGLSPSLMGLDQQDREGLLRFLRTSVDQGLRAKLAMGNLLTGTLYVNLSDEPSAAPIAFDPTADTPELPAVASDIEELTGSVEGILDRVDALPIERLMANAVTLLESVNRIAASDSTQAIPETTLNAIKAVEALLSRPELGQATVDAQALVAALRAVAEDPALKTAPGRLDALLGSLAAVTGELEKQNTAAELAATIAAVRKIAERPELATLPATAARALEAAEALISRPELGQTAVEAEALVKSLRALIDDPGLKAAPAKLDAMLGSLAAISAELEQQNTAADLAATVAALRAFAEQPELAKLPGRAEGALAAAETLLARPELGRTAVEAEALVKSLRTIVDDPGLKAAPAKLDAMLGSLAAISAELEQQNTAADLAATVAALRAFAEQPELAKLPGRAEGALAAAETLLARPELGRTAVEAEALVKSLRTIVDDPGLKAAPAKLDALLGSLAAISAELEESKTAANLGATVAALRAVAESPELKRLPGQADAALEALEALLSRPALQEMPGQINQTLADLRKALDLPGLDKVPAELSLTLASVRTRLDDPALAQTLKELPPLIKQTRTAVADVGSGADAALKSLSRLLDDPGIKQVPGELAATLTAARTLLDDEGLRTATGEAGATLAALRRILEDPKTRAAPGELTATLASARTLLRSLEEQKAAENLASALAAAERLLADPALARASNELADTLGAVRAVLATEGAKELPPALVDALRSATLLIDDFQKQNVSRSAAGALDGVNEASRALAQSAKGLPQLIARLSQVSARADGLLKSVGVGSELNYEAVTAIREIRDAARAIIDLSDQIRRRPNSIILGK